MKYTPGPWFVMIKPPNENSLDTTKKAELRVYHNGDYDIHRNDEINLESMANACLISAAPELLELAYLAVNFARDGKVMSETAIKHFQKAIAKAEGEKL